MGRWQQTHTGPSAPGVRRTPMFSRTTGLTRGAPTSFSSRMGWPLPSRVSRHPSACRWTCSGRPSTLRCMSGRTCTTGSTRSTCPDRRRRHPRLLHPLRRRTHRPPRTSAGTPRPAIRTPRSPLPQRSPMIRIPQPPSKSAGTGMATGRGIRPGPPRTRPSTPSVPPRITPSCSRRSTQAASPPRRRTWFPWPPHNRLPLPGTSTFTPTRTTGSSGSLR